MLGPLTRDSDEWVVKLSNGHHPLPATINGTVRSSWRGMLSSFIVLLIRLCTAAEYASTQCNWTHHRHEPNVLLLDLPEGVPIRDPVESACLQFRFEPPTCASILQSIRGRHKSVSLDGTAPYPIQLHITLPWTQLCHELLVEAPGHTVKIVFDVHDDFDTLAASTCAYILTVPDVSCPARITAEMARLSAADDQATFASCPAARARRLADRHACAGPWESADKVAETKKRCLPSPDPSSDQTTATCLIRNLYVHNSEWYVATEWPEKWPAIQLGTRRDSPWLKIARNLSVHELALRASHSPARRVLSRPLNLLHILLARWQPFTSGEGHGHTLHDVALPSFWASLSAETVVPSPDRVQLVLLDGELRAPADEWLETVSTRPPIYAHELASFLCPPHCWCVIPRALVGIGGRSYFAMNLGGGLPSHSHTSLDSFSNLHFLFAAYARSALGLHLAHNRDEASTKERASMVRVLIIKRLHSRVLLNINDIAAALQAGGDATRPWNVSILALDFMEPRAQLSAIDQADLIVAVEGGALDLLLLATPGLAAVVIGRNPELPWPEGCSGCGVLEQFTHGNLLHGALSWLPSSRVPCCARRNANLSGASPGEGHLNFYAPDPGDILAAARDALAAAKHSETTSKGGGRQLLRAVQRVEALATQYMPLQ